MDYRLARQNPPYHRRWETWEPQESGTFNELYSVYFLDANLGWVSGQYGLILHTADGGKTWKTQYSRTKANLNKIFFVSPTVGIAVGDEGTLLLTQDGGKTWARETSGTDKNLRDISVTEDKLFAVGEDGIAIAYTIPSISKYTPRKRSFDETETDLPKIDAGWDILRNDGPFRIMGADTGMKSTDISFINPIEGWAVGNSRTMLHTLDGGNTWKSVKSPVDTPLVAVHFVSSEIGWLLTEDASFLSTTDGGRTWQVLNEATKPVMSGYDQNSQRIEEACQLYTAYFQGFGEGWAAGEQGVILHNRDGNTIWTHRENETSASYRDLQMVGEYYGWAVGSWGKVLWTNDQGSTWHLQTTNTGYDLYGVSFLNRRKGWTVGRDGIVLRTSNGGLRWSAVDVGVSTHLYDVTFINEMEGWIVGEGGLILHTKDRGATWEIEKSGTDEDLYHVDSVEGLGVVVLGAHGTILKRKLETQS